MPRAAASTTPPSSWHPPAARASSSTPTARRFLRSPSGCRRSSHRSGCGDVPWLGAWQRDGRQVVDLALRDGRTLRVAPLICYDAVYPDLAREEVRRGGELFVTLSNDSWFATGGGPRLHLVVSAFRSIETRRPQLRVTNTGISAVIDATGELVATAGVHERAALRGRVYPERAATTLVLALGEWLGPVSLAASVAMLLPRALAQRR
jgi:apolipoprotein N-acyltransferase